MSKKVNMISVQNILMLILGVAIYAFGIHYFVVANEFMEGGITGIALLLQYVLAIPPSISTLLLNAPLFLIGWKWLGKSQMTLTVIGSVSLSGFLWVMEQLIAVGLLVPLRMDQDYFLAILYAGVTTGVGLGLVFRFGGTTGGSDIVARLGNKLLGWSMGTVLLGFDALVLGASLLYLPREKVLYTLVMVFIATKVIDFITEGAYAAKVFTIITIKGAEISSAITRELERGVTLLPAVGAYSREEKDYVYCVVSRSEVRRLKMLVKSIDPLAFLVIGDAHEVLGEGFKQE